MAETLTLKALSSLTYPPSVIMSSFVIFWLTPPPPPPVMTSFMNSPLWINDPFLEIFSGPLLSVYAHNFTSERLFQRIELEMVNINCLVFPNGNVRFCKIAILGI